MKFHSGFSFQNEKELFTSFLDDSKYCVAGFSYGAIAAFEDVKDRLRRDERVDRLQLLSPSFFQTKSKKFKKLQTMFYIQNAQTYVQNLRINSFAPYKTQKLEYSEHSLESLKILLEHTWSRAAFLELEQKGVIIEVYLGAKDAIIEIQNARVFFRDVATLTYLKDANHFLQKN